MEDFLQTVSALKDETRIKLLKFLLIHKELCVCEIEASFAMLQSRLSRHLKILKDAGFLHSKRSGKKVFYSIKERDDFRRKLLQEVASLQIDLPLLKECFVKDGENKPI